MAKPEMRPRRESNPAPAPQARLRLEDSHAVNRIVERFAADYALSGREAQVVAFFARGLTTKEIASTLGLSYKTVAQYWNRVLGKVGCRSQGIFMARFLEFAVSDARPDDRWLPEQD